MYPWLMLWAPQFTIPLHFPFSGSVAQRIEPQAFFDAIPGSAGDGRIERQAFEVASYGRQLGLLSEVLIDLAKDARGLGPQAAKSLKRLEGIQARIEAIKRETAREDAPDLEAALQRLQEQDPAAFAQLLARLRPALPA